MNPARPFIWNFRGRKSIRLKGYDYSVEGCYFITICTRNRACLFGEVRDGKMILNKMGHIVQDEWKKVGRLRKNVRLDAFIIMPNHLHIILWIDGRRGEALPRPEPIKEDGATQSVRNGATQSVARTRKGPASHSIGSIIGVFKSCTTKSIRSLGYQSAIWQRNYWERIVRDEEALWMMQEYVRNNPKNWKKDPDYREG